MKNEEQNIQTVKNVMRWGNEDLIFYKGKFPDETFETFKKINAFTQTIEGNFEAKLEAVKKQFPKEFK
jgi:hypothetical protein